MTPEVLYFIPGQLEDPEKHIKIADRNYVLEKNRTSTFNNDRQ